MVEYANEMIKAPIIIDNVSRSLSHRVSNHMYEGVGRDESRILRRRETTTRLQHIVSHLLFPLNISIVALVVQSTSESC